MNAIRVTGGSTSAGNVVLGGARKTLVQSGGTISVTGGSFLTANDTFAQSGGRLSLGNGAGNAVAATVQQTGTDARIESTSGSLSFGKAFSSAANQQGAVSSAENLSLAGNNTLAGGVSASGDLMAGGNITQTGGSIDAGGTLSAGTLTQSGPEGTSVSAGNILANVSQTGAGTISATAIGTAENAKSVAQSGSGSIYATTIHGTTVSQSAGSGEIYATTVNGQFSQAASGATLEARYSSDGLKLGSAVTTQNGTISGSGGDVTLAGGDTLSGIVEAADLKAGDGSGNITQTAGSIDVAGTIAAGTFKQDGAAEKSATASTVAAKVEQAGTGKATLAANGRTLTLADDVTQDNANATIGTAGTDVVVKKGFTQTRGTIEADRLSLDNADQDVDYDLAAGKNAVGTLTGKAKSVQFANGTADLAVSDLETKGDIEIQEAGAIAMQNVTAGTVSVAEDGSVSVPGGSGGSIWVGNIAAKSVGSVDFDNVKAENVIVGKGDVSDSGDGLFATAVQFGGNEKVGTVLIDNSRVVNIAHVDATGDVGVKAEKIAQTASTISGRNVSLVSTGSDAFEIKNGITATGDVLVEATEGNLSVGAATIEAKGTISDETIMVAGESVDHAFGNVVLKGRNVVVGGTDADHKATIKAKTGVGIAATDESGYVVETESYADDKGAVSIGAHTDVVAPKAIVTAFGDLEIKAGARMDDPTTSEDKDADLTVFTENALNMGLDSNTRGTT